MIFVTVGNTAFDRLVKAADSLNIGENIVIQKADGTYTPRKHKYFEYGNLDEYFKKANVVITHGGAGNIFRLLGMHKKVIAVANMDRKDKHQPDLLNKLSHQKNIIWCKDVKELSKSIHIAKLRALKPYRSPKCTIAQEIIRYVQ